MANFKADKSKNKSDMCRTWETEIVIYMLYRFTSSMTIREHLEDFK